MKQSKEGETYIVYSYTVPYVNQPIGSESVHIETSFDQEGVNGIGFKSQVKY